MNYCITENTHLSISFVLVASSYANFSFSIPAEISAQKTDILDTLTLHLGKNIMYEGNTHNLKIEQNIKSIRMFAS